MARKTIQEKAKRKTNRDGTVTVTLGDTSVTYQPARKLSDAERKESYKKFAQDLGVLAKMRGHREQPKVLWKGRMYTRS